MLIDLVFVCLLRSIGFKKKKKSSTQSAHQIGVHEGYFSSWKEDTKSTNYYNYCMVESLRKDLRIQLPATVNLPVKCEKTQIILEEFFS